MLSATCSSILEPLGKECVRVTNSSLVLDRAHHIPAANPFSPQVRLPKSDRDTTNSEH